MFFKTWFRSKNSKRSHIRDVEFYLLDAIEAFEESDFHDASKKFGLIAKAMKDHPLAHLMLGRCYIEVQQYEKAVEALFDHLRVVPDSVEARIYLGLAYYECGELQRAEERFEEAIELRKESLLARENLAIARMEAGSIGPAIDELFRLHIQHPRDQEIIDLLVLALGRLGRWESAKQYIRIKEGLAMSES